MRSLISADPTLLMVLTRFGISLGFGDKLVEEVCADTGSTALRFSPWQTL